MPLYPAQDSELEAVAALVNSAYRGDSSRVGWTTEADYLSGSGDYKGQGLSAACTAKGKPAIGKIVIHEVFSAKRAAQMNEIVNAEKVHCTMASVDFEFETDKDMGFKKALVELAYHCT